MANKDRAREVLNLWKEGDKQEQEAVSVEKRARLANIIESAGHRTDVDPNLPDPRDFGTLTRKQELHEQFGRTETTPQARIAGAFSEPLAEADLSLPASVGETVKSDIPGIRELNDLLVKGVASPVYGALMGLGAGANAVIDGMVQTGVEAGVVKPDFASRMARDLKGGLEVGPALHPGLLTPQSLSAKGASRDMAARLPEAAPTMAEEAASLPHPIPLTKGRATNSISEQRFENEAQRGVYGDRAARLMSMGDEATEVAAKANIEELRAGVSGSNFARAQGEGAEFAAKQLNKSAREARARISAAYEDAGKKGGAVKGRFMTEFARNTRNKLDQLEMDVNNPSVARHLAAFEGLDGGINPVLVSKIEMKRKNLSRAASNAYSNDRELWQTLKTIRDDLDLYLDDLVTEGLVSGSEEAIDAFKNARSLRIQFGKTFEPSKVMKKMSSEEFNTEEALNLMFGMGGTGFKNPSGRLMGDVKRALGAESEAFGALREEALIRLMRNQPEEGFSGQKFRTSFNKAMDNSPTVMRELFDPAEIKFLDKVSRVAQRGTTFNPAALNPGGSGITMKAAAQLSKMPVFGRMLDEMNDVKAAGRVRRNLSFQEEVSQQRTNPAIFTQALQTAVLAQEEKKQK